jgi:hypothetical protein
MVIVEQAGGAELIIKETTTPKRIRNASTAGRVAWRPQDRSVGYINPVYGQQILPSTFPA